jgi:hypothetical protein
MSKKQPEPRNELEALQQMKLPELLQFAERHRMELHGMARLNEEAARKEIVVQLGGEDY